MEFWNEVIIDKSFRILQNLKKRFDFILIGGWAIYILTKAIKSKDIDIVVDFDTLSQIKKELEISKTDFLKKYQAEVEEVSIDIYVPYYSEFIIPIEDMIKNTISLEGFKIPKSEILLFLKLQAEAERSESVKGQKDRVDILLLLMKGKIDFENYKKLIEKYSLKKYNERLKGIVRTAKKEFEYIGIRDLRQIKKIKNKILGQIS